MKYPQVVELSAGEQRHQVYLCRLETTEARQLIDDIWWHDADGEFPDSHWRWADIVQKFRYNRRKFDCLVLKCNDGNALGALAHRVDTSSVLDEGCGSVMMLWLAVEPRSRRSARNRVYSGVGTKLVQHAVQVSFQLGLSGRVNCFPIPEAIPFFEKLGFQETDTRNSEGALLYEISAHEAAVLIGA